MNKSDQQTLVLVIEDARQILGEYIAPGPRDASRTVERLPAVLDNMTVIYALDPMKERSVLRLLK